MRIVLVLLAVGLVVGLAAAMFFRTTALPPEVWHVDPATVRPPESPNYELRIGAEAPVYNITPEQLAARIDAVATAEQAELIGGSLAEGWMTYVARSRIMGFPDAVSIRLTGLDGGTRMEIF